MKKAALMVSLLLTGNAVLAEGAVVDGLAAFRTEQAGALSLGFASSLGVPFFTCACRTTAERSKLVITESLGNTGS
jgi:hypothetical protein